MSIPIETARAMLLDEPGAPLRLVERSLPTPATGEIRVRVEACAVCRTDLHVADGELPNPKLPLVLGHEIVGIVEAVGAGVDPARTGRRVGVPWLGRTCSTCPYCRAGRENLCDDPLFTGYTRDGGFASHAIASADFAFDLDPAADPVTLAPLMCAGLIGWRCLKKAGEAQHLGIYGFGAAAHIVAQVALWQGRRIYAFTRPGDLAAQDFALSLGASWAAGSDVLPGRELDAAIIFAPVGSLVPRALEAVRKGGRVVCGGIHMSDIPAMPYARLWQERELLSVANLTRADALEFLPLASKAGVRTQTVRYPLESANQALADLRSGAFSGAAVLVP